MENLEQVKLKNSSEGQTATYSLNQFADMSKEEIKASLRKPGPEITSVKTNPLKVDNLLQNLDWRTRGIITNVKNQGQCDSSYAFVVVEALTALNAVDDENVIEYSAQELIDCSSTVDNGGCNGGSIQSAYQYVMQNGIQTAASYPYTGVPGKCKADKKATRYTPDQFNIIPINDNDAMLQAVNYLPISVGIASADLVFYKSGIVSQCRSTSIDQYMLVVGYGTD